jgi:hypothetical protein
MQAKYQKDGTWSVRGTKPEIEALKKAARILTPLIELPTDAKESAEQCCHLLECLSRYLSDEKMAVKESEKP